MNQHNIFSKINGQFTIKNTCNKIIIRNVKIVEEVGKNILSQPFNIQDKINNNIQKKYLSDITSYSWKLEIKKIFMIFLKKFASTNNDYIVIAHWHVFSVANCVIVNFPVL